MIRQIPGSVSPKYGFQKSENTRAEVIIYPHLDDPIVLTGRLDAMPKNLIGNKGTDTESSVLSVTTTKSISDASGKFSVVVKASKVSPYLLNSVMDDDWIDIAFYIDSSPYHTFRGIIDEINRSKTVSNGATVATYTIIGRCFGKVWEATPVWFSPYYNDIVTEAVSSRVFNGIPEFVGAPDKAVISYLKGFLESIEANKGVNWLPPKNMPGLIDNTFLGNVEFNEEGEGSKYFQNIPKRIGFNENALMPEGNLWDLAKSYSDSMFTEMYVDYLPDGNPFSEDMSSPLEVGNGKMTVIMRDKPFPVLDSSAPIGYESTWESLPIFTVQPQEIITHDVSKSGYERYNAFFVASRILQEDIQNYALNLLPPLMDAESIKRHGFRRFDVTSNVHPDIDNPVSAGGTNVDEMCQYQRKIIRDWYCLNPYMLSGTITLGHGRPDIRMGCRLHIPEIKLSHKESILEENYYIEQVSLNWSFGAGVRTSLGVTRGWFGDLRSYYDSLNKMASRYTLPSLGDVEVL